MFGDIVHSRGPLYWERIIFFHNFSLLFCRTVTLQTEIDFRGSHHEKSKVCAVEKGQIKLFWGQGVATPCTQQLGAQNWK